MSEEDIPEFVGNLQAIGVTLAAYLGAYANAHHPNALEDKRKYEADGARKRKHEETTSTSGENSKFRVATQVTQAHSVSVVHFQFLNILLCKYEQFIHRLKNFLCYKQRNIHCLPFNAGETELA